MRVMQNISLPLCHLVALCGVLRRYLSISCYVDEILNFYYFIAILLGKTCSMSLMTFNNRIFYILFYSGATLSKFSQFFKVLMFTIKTVVSLTL